jgi:methylmalonyl-CoA mutase N-terminal domain/subunit
MSRWSANRSSACVRCAPGVIPAKWQAALQAVEDTARGTGNLMPVIVEAVEVNATVGEISDAMRRVYGEYHERVVI